MLGKNILKIQPYPIEIDGRKKSKKADSTKNEDFEQVHEQAIGIADEGQDEGTKSKKKKKETITPPAYIIKVEDADVTNWKYKYNGYASYM